MKKAFIWIIGIIAALCLVVWFTWRGEITSINSVTSVEGNPYLYKMEYKASYDLDDLIAKDIDENAELLNYVVGRIGKGLPLKIKSAQVADENGELATFNCTSFQAVNAGGEGFLFGRNYDYFSREHNQQLDDHGEGHASGF